MLISKCPFFPQSSTDLQVHTLYAHTHEKYLQSNFDVLSIRRASSRTPGMTPGSDRSLTAGKKSVWANSCRVRAFPLGCVCVVCVLSVGMFHLHGARLVQLIFPPPSMLHANGTGTCREEQTSCPFIFHQWMEKVNYVKQWRYQGGDTLYSIVKRKWVPSLLSEKVLVDGHAQSLEQHVHFTLCSDEKFLPKRGQAPCPLWGMVWKTEQGHARSRPQSNPLTFK